MILAWLNRAAGTLQVGHKEVHLTPQECLITDRLIKARGQEVSCDDLLFAVYNGSHEPAHATESIKVYIYRLRDKGLPIEPRIPGRRYGYWLDGVDWFTKGQRFKVPTGTIRIERVVLVPSLIYYHENLGITEVIPLSDPRIEKWEAS